MHTFFNTVPRGPGYNPWSGDILRNQPSAEFCFSEIFGRPPYIIHSLIYNMPSKPTKSILKQSHPKSTSKVGSSRSANPSAEAGPSTLNRNTKLNSGSKFSKKVNVERATISRPSKRRLVEEDEEEEDSEDGEDDFPQDEGEGEGEDVDMDGEDSGLDTDEEIARGMNSKDGSSKKSTSQYSHSFQPL